MPVELPGFTQIFWLLLAASVVAMAARRFQLPYALALVVTGLVIGAPRLLPEVRLQPALLFGVLLPPLLFEAALNLPADSLRRDWRPIAIYSLLATAAAALVVGWLTARALGISLAAGMVFGALIAATDPISVLAVFRRLHANRRLTLLVEAESLFNDGIAVVLFSGAMLAALGNALSPGAAVWQFLSAVAGGAAVGLVIGWLAARVHLAVDDHLVEITLTTVAAYGSYLAAETLHVSGVIAVIGAGVVVGSFGIPRSMTPSTQLAVGTFWEYAAFLANSIVFLLIGIEAAGVRWWTNLPLVAGAIGAVLLGRLSVYPLSLLVNAVGGNVPLRWQHVIVWGGLRGALSMALALGLPPGFPHRDKLIAGTFGVVLFSLLAQGLTIGPLLRRLGLAEPRGARTEFQRIAAEMLVCEAAMRELDRLLQSEAHPNWAVRSLAEQYRAEFDRLAARARALELDPEALPNEQRLAAQRLILTAQKNTLAEAERHGWLQEEDWRRLTERIDAELSALVSAEAVQRDG